MNETDQSEAIAFLASGAAHGCSAGEVELVETHGALVFLGGDDVYKIKRAVRYAYMDLTALETRRRLCARELELNRPQAPGLYLGLVAIMRGPDGRLALGGDGEVVEWALHMRKFAADALLSCKVERGEIDARLAAEVADAVFQYHAAAERCAVGRPVTVMGGVLAGLEDGLGLHTSRLRSEDVERLIADCRRALSEVAGRLEERRRLGFVRRCHGDLHLENIVMWRGRPVLFDALEFDEALATIDVLYDLAFLLMDLDVRGHRAAANVVLNRYLWRSGELADLQGLAAMPLFLAVRAAVRAMVLAQRAELRKGAASDEAWQRAERYLGSALGFLVPRSPRLIAVGGMSGTGKSTLAAALAPDLGSAPGAIVLRSDLERKALFGVGDTDRLPDASYSQEANRRVYDRLLIRARAALEAGHAVILDAAYLQEAERRAAEQLAVSVSVPFKGVWLTAPPDILASRIAARAGDASDATVDVLRKQLAWKPHGGSWPKVDASADAASTLGAAREALDLKASA